MSFRSMFSRLKPYCVDKMGNAIGFARIIIVPTAMIGMVYVVVIGGAKSRKDLEQKASNLEKLFVESIRSKEEVNKK
jgi:hypothetical protein